MEVCMRHIDPRFFYVPVASKRDAVMLFSLMTLGTSAGWAHEAAPLRAAIRLHGWN